MVSAIGERCAGLCKSLMHPIMTHLQPPNGWRWLWSSTLAHQNSMHPSVHGRWSWRVLHTINTGLWSRRTHSAGATKNGTNLLSGPKLPNADSILRTGNVHWHVGTNMLPGAREVGPLRNGTHRAHTVQPFAQSPLHSLWLCKPHPGDAQRQMRHLAHIQPF